MPGCPDGCDQAGDDEQADREGDRTTESGATPSPAGGRRKGHGLTDPTIDQRAAASRDLDRVGTHQHVVDGHLSDVIVHGARPP